MLKDFRMLPDGNRSALRDCSPTNPSATGPTDSNKMLETDDFVTGPEQLERALSDAHRKGGAAKKSRRGKSEELEPRAVRKPRRLKAGAETLMDNNETATAAGFAAGPEHLERDLNAAYRKYVIGHDAAYAMHALGLIWSANAYPAGDRAGISAQELVSVPMWVAEAIYAAWRMAAAPAAQGTKFRLGQLLGTEGLKKGAPPRLREIAMEHRDRNIAVWLAERVLKGEKLESLLASLEASEALDRRQLLRIWEEHGDAMKALLERHLPR